MTQQTSEGERRLDEAWDAWEKFMDFEINCNCTTQRCDNCIPQIAESDRVRKTAIELAKKLLEDFPNDPVFPEAEELWEQIKDLHAFMGSNACL